MGQQQLILLVIGIVVVAFAILAAHEILDHHFRQDEADGLLDRTLSIANHAVYWKTKNDPFAGGNQSYEILGTNGMAQLGLDTATVRGRFDITGATESTVEIRGVSDRFAEVGVQVTVEDYDIAETLVRFDGTITLGEDD